MQNRHIAKWVGWMGVGLLVFILLVPVQTAGMSYRQSCFMDLMHVPFAMIFSALILALVCGPRGRQFPPWPVAAMLVGAFILSEWIQPHFQRSFSWLDMYYDFLGVVGGWILYAAYRQRAKILLWGLIAVLASALTPYSVQMMRLNTIEHRFPLLSDFSFPLESPHWEAVNAEFRQGDEPGTGREGVSLDAGSAAYFLEHPVQNWTGYASLEVEFLIEGQGIATLRIDDRKHTVNYFDRFQLEVSVTSGINRICLDLKGQTINSGDRPLDWTSIHQVGLILPPGEAGQRFSLINLELREQECY